MPITNRATHNERIANYYDQNYPATRFLWTNSQSLALHFGYWEEDTCFDFEAHLNANQLNRGSDLIGKVYDPWIGDKYWNCSWIIPVINIMP